MKPLIAAAAVAISLIGWGVGSAHADGRDDRYERHRNHGHHRLAREHREHHRDHRHWRDHRDSYRSGHVRRYREQRHYDHAHYHYIPPNGYYARAWRRGDYLPRSYCSARYVVHDYHLHGLGRPPRGHHWVRVDNDVLLAAVASGLVVQALYGVF